MRIARAFRTIGAVLLLAALVVPLSAQDDGARQTVGAFLTAWDRADSAAMWALLSPAKPANVSAGSLHQSLHRGEYGDGA
ncbi:MAG: hypothetical protein HND48_04705 [Chloroflexi bacterium]|nr:hypothetical protein [Chloroflexota bacterium]